MASAAERLRDAGRDPLAWTFVRLLGRQLQRDVRELPGLPAVQAWRPRANEDEGNASQAAAAAAAAAASERPRVLTKARCLGVLVSVLPKAERVELLVDDGTALVKAVLWGDPERADVALGDLVEVEGRVQSTAGLDGADACGTHPRELRVLRLSRLDDPNEELLHWIQTMELTRTYYSSATGEAAAAESAATAAPGSSAPGDEQWERTARDAFFRLRIVRASAHSSAAGLGGQRERVLLDVLERVLRQQRVALASADASADAMPRAVRVTFSAALERLRAVPRQDAGAESGHVAAVRDLRYAFRTLRSSGLLSLEDEEADRYELLSYEFALRPAIVEVVAGRPAGVSPAEVASALTALARFQRVPLAWIEQGVTRAVEEGTVRRQADSRLARPAAARSA